MLPLYENALQKIDADALEQLYSTHMANDAIALIKGKIKDIMDFNKVLNEIGPLDEAKILGELKESDVERYEKLCIELELKRDKVCESPLMERDRKEKKVKESIESISKETTLRDIKAVQEELEEGYIEVENPAQTRECDSQSLDNK